MTLRTQMMREQLRCGWRVLLLLAALLFAFASAVPQRAQNPANYTVRGVVVNSVTGEPVRGALVQIYSNQQHNVLTGADGAFQFADIPAGQINVNVQKPGFFPEQAIRSPLAQATFITSGPDQPPAVLKLVPEGVISGHVIGDGGEPVERLPVQLLAYRVENGKKRREVFRGGQTDEEGEFRIAELPPGKYIVFAGPSRRPEFALRAGTHAVVHGYPGAFYPGAADISGASEVEVAAGQRAEVNFSFQSQPFHRISGTLSGYPQNGGISLQAINAAGQQMPAGFQSDPRNGTFRTTWLPAGEYTLTAATRDMEGKRGYYASQSVNLASDVSGVHLHLLPGLSIPVSIRVDQTRNDSRQEEPPEPEFISGNTQRVRRQQNVPARVELITEGDGGMQQARHFSQVDNAEGTSSEIPDVPSGVYSVQVFPNGPWYVESARSGSLNLLEQSLTVAAGSAVEPIEIVLRDDFASLEGSVALGAEMSDAMALAVPEGSQQIRSVGLARAAVLDPHHPTASFDMEQLGPGTYRVLAVDRAEGFEYRNPDVLQRYLSKAREISLSPNQRGKVELELVHVGE